MILGAGYSLYSTVVTHNKILYKRKNIIVLLLCVFEIDAIYMCNNATVILYKNNSIVDTNYEPLHIYKPHKGLLMDYKDLKCNERTRYRIYDNVLLRGDNITTYELGIKYSSVIEQYLI